MDDATERLIVRIHSREANADAMAVATALLANVLDAGARDMAAEAAIIAQDIAEDPAQAAAVIINLGATLASALVVAGVALNEPPDRILAHFALAGQQ